MLHHNSRRRVLIGHTHTLSIKLLYLERVYVCPKFKCRRLGLLRQCPTSDYVERPLQRPLQIRCASTIAQEFQIFRPCCHAQWE